MNLWSFDEVGRDWWAVVGFRAAASGGCLYLIGRPIKVLVFLFAPTIGLYILTYYSDYYVVILSK